jgi:16S rRNA A1518/A1519 N6-dimethyltransferase RsmA/KsgA/DIM1 with predicted DNA glycosylase/AP lyase activity
MEKADNGHKFSRNGTTARLASWPSQIFLFAKNFAKHPSMIGWMFPSSPFVVDQVLKQIDWERMRVIVEYGPGLGTFTKDILKRMHPEAKLVAFETNGDFCRFLDESLSDPRFHLLNESATEIDSALKRLGLPPTTFSDRIENAPFARRSTGAIKQASRWNAQELEILAHLPEHVFEIRPHRTG